MSVKYIPNGSVKIVVEKTTYQNKDGKKAVLPTDKIHKDELERLLKNKLIVKLDLDEEGVPTKSKPAKEAKRDKLLVKARELGITVEDSMTDAEIEQKIKDALAREKLLEKAEELDIEVKDEMTNDEIQKAIKAAKA